MGRPKALLEYRGKTFLQTIVDLASKVADLTVVVVPAESPNLLSKNDLSGVIVVTNHRVETGPIGSIRVALDCLDPHPVRGLLVWPVDFPHVAPDTVRRLIEAFQASDLPIAVPECDGTRGHPVLFSRSVFDELRSPDADRGARWVVRRDQSRVLTVKVPDRAITTQINTMEDYRRLLELEQD